MNNFYGLMVVLQVLSSLVIIGLVLLQHGKGADMGASFGSGASGSLFGASGSSNFLTKSTALAAAVFFISTLVLAGIGSNRHSGSVTERVAAPAPVTAPASAPAPAASAAVPAAPAAPAASVPASAPAASAASAASGK
ncbi:preprotein translocase subunit SecG [Massilia sp. W12]|uniref:preprotein translocase subunit SecG n=1 Tax=Massilia sp. W12 TaxID=3126507 RepID=UPI0030D62C35